MEFFDQKQEVLDVQLTPFGRYLLSLGRLKPVYYAFFDDDIIYDGAYGGIVETQNDIEDRILRGTPRLKQQTIFGGVETNYKKQAKLIRNADQAGSHGHELVDGPTTSSGYTNMQHPLTRDYALGMPLGKTILDNNDPPRWQLLLLSGKIESSAKTLDDQTIGSELRIPQIDIDIVYELTAHNINDETYEELEAQAIVNNNHITFSPVFDDGTFLKMEGQHVLLMLEEKNVPFEKENFEIEVFEETIESRRFAEVINGVTVTSSRQEVGHLPLFFSPQSYGSFEADTHHRPDMILSEEGTIEATFMLNNDDTLSVPSSYLQDIIASPQQINEALQSNSSYYFSKPPLRTPTAGSVAGYGTDIGKLSGYEADVYFTGVEMGDPEDCE